MHIRQVGLFWKGKDSVGRKGHTVVPCEFCGRFFVGRLRMVWEHNGVQKVRHVCIQNNCLGKLVGEVGYEPDNAGKIRSNLMKEIINCDFCGRDARGGIWVERNNEPFGKKERTNVCFTCVEERLKAAEEGKVEVNSGDEVRGE